MREFFFAVNSVLDCCRKKGGFQTNFGRNGTKCYCWLSRKFNTAIYSSL